MSGLEQVIPARNGVATFVPSGSAIKIINTSGTQVIDTWAFRLHNAPDRPSASGSEQQEVPDAAKYVNGKKQSEEANENVEEVAEQDASWGPSATGWTSYLPSLRTKSKASNVDEARKEQSRRWSSYFSSRKGFTSYLPSRNSISAFAASHYRDLDTNSENPPMEFLSMTHSRVNTLHLIPQVNDTLVSNLRTPLLTLVEDTSPGIHDTLIPACDPQRYRAYGVENWEEHGSCSENLVMALQQLNEKAGLRGIDAVGADVTVNMVPAPLNLFMNIPWDNKGNIKFERPQGKAGDFVRFKAETDVVVVMSACPNDVTDINGKEITDGHFLVEDTWSTSTKHRKTKGTKRRAEPESKADQKMTEPDKIQAKQGRKKPKKLVKQAKSHAES